MTLTEDDVKTLQIVPCRLVLAAAENWIEREWLANKKNRSPRRWVNGEACELLSWIIIRVDIGNIPWACSNEFDYRLFLICPDIMSMTRG